jgi:hypothetical protein
MQPTSGSYTTTFTCDSDSITQDGQLRNWLLVGASVHPLDLVAATQSQRQSTRAP